MTAGAMSQQPANTRKATAASSPPGNSQRRSEVSSDSEDDTAAFFSSRYEPVTSTTLSDAEYCLHLAHAPGWETVAAAVSDGPLVVLQSDTLEKVLTLKPHQGTVSGLRFSPTDANIIWTSGRDGYLKMWDTRTGKSEKEFSGKKDNSVGDRPVTCMDVSRNERILCAGTEQVADGAFILFWDVRGDKLLGTYTECHTDDLTQVKFSYRHPDTLATSSTDCLVNVFDISQKQEDDALTYCLNTEVAIDKLFWLNHPSGEERLAGLTDLETLQYWDVKEAAPLHQFTRLDIATAMKCKHPDDCYLVSINALGDDSLTVLCGSRSSSGNFSDRLRTLKFSTDSGELKPYGSFLPKQKLLTTRTSLYHAVTDTYITGGECGIVRLWKPEAIQVVGKQPLDKGSKKRRIKPY